jgi:DNA excision repair protein ERCC-5
MRIATRTWKKFQCKLSQSTFLVDFNFNVKRLSRPVLPTPDPDLQEYQREMALSAISNRTSSKNLRPVTTRAIDRKSKRVPLFDLDDDDELLEEQPVVHDSELNDDDLVAYAIQQSFDESNLTKNVTSTSQNKPTSSTTRPISTSRDSSPEDDFYLAPTRLETALSIANAAASSRVQSSPSQSVPIPTLFGRPTLLVGPSKQPQILAPLSSSDDEIKMVATSSVRNDRTFFSGLLQGPEVLRPVTPKQAAPSLPISIEDDDDDMEEVPVLPLHNTTHDSTPLIVACPRPDKSPSPFLPLVPSTEEVQNVPSVQGPVIVPQDADLTHDPLFIISRTPSPSHEAADLRPLSPPIAEDWDAAEEMDVQAEEGEFARFISQVKGKDLGSVRREIDEEIKALNDQRKAAMRDSEDITQQMVSQIMVWNTSFSFSIQSSNPLFLDDVAFFRHTIHYGAYGSRGTVR